jgi:hypothetical protein
VVSLHAGKSAPGGLDAPAAVMAKVTNSQQAAAYPRMWTPAAAAVAMGLFPREMDEQLVGWAAVHTVKPVEAPPPRDDGDDAPPPPRPAVGPDPTRRTVASPLTMQPAELRLDEKEASYSAQVLSRAPLAALHARVAVLQYFNEQLMRVLDLVDIGADAGGGGGDDAALASAALPALVGAYVGAFGTPAAAATAAARLPRQAVLLSKAVRSARHVIFADAKQRLIDAIIAATWTPGGRTPGVSVTLDNMAAATSRDAGSVDVLNSQSIFSQLFRCLSKLGPDAMNALFRSRLDDRGRLFRTNYEGESGIDAGGVFADAINATVEHCFSDRLDLLVPVPNARASSTDGTNADKFLVNPAYAHPTHARAAAMLEFLGRLIGFSVRSAVLLPYEFPPFVWKQLVGDRPSFEDLHDVDAATADLVASVLNWAPPPAATAAAAGAGAGAGGGGAGDAEAAFAAAFPRLFMATKSSDGRDVDLVPGGRGVPVTAATRAAWAAAVLQFHFTAADKLVDAIRRGMHSVLPRRAVQLMSWQELEIAAAGRPEVDVEAMKAHTDYEGYRATDPTVVLLWKVMASLTNEERCLFIKFVWGRSRVPAGRWPRRMKICRLGGSEDRLPLAHTCFMSVEIPEYARAGARGEEKMRWALLTAIHSGGGILNA